MLLNLCMDTTEFELCLKLVLVLFNVDYKGSLVIYGLIISKNINSIGYY